MTIGLIAWICFIIYIFSFGIVCATYGKYNVEPSIWAILSTLIPVVNTVIAILIIPSYGFNRFIRELNNIINKKAS